MPGVRLKLTIAYDGAAFKGWQSQPFGLTVQDALEDTLRRITGGRVVVRASGRTDTGVHALGQVAHIDVEERFTPAKWRMVLNYNLPPTIRIMQCEEVSRKFHARFDARGKVYRYLIRTEDVLTPHEIDRVWMLPEKLDGKLLREATQLFVGRHDFVGFAAKSNDEPKTTVRTISRITVSTRGSLIGITYHGEGFLYRMVRLLTGAIVQVAQGREDLVAMKARLEGTLPPWTKAAPPDGLYLVRVIY